MSEQEEAELDVKDLLLKVTDQEFVPQFAVNKLVEHPQNPNVGDEDIIMESVEINDFYGFLVVQKGTNHVLVGNHRLRVAKTLGATTLPVFVVNVDDEAAYRIVLADNQTAKRSRKDDQLLIDALKFVSTESGGVVGTGYSLQEIEMISQSLELDEYEADENDFIEEDDDGETPDFIPQGDEEEESESVAKVGCIVGDIRFKVPHSEMMAAMEKIKEKYGTSWGDVKRGFLTELGFPELFNGKDKEDGEEIDSDENEEDTSGEGETEAES